MVALNWCALDSGDRCAVSARVCQVEPARNSFIAAGVLLLGVYLVTDYRAAVGDNVYASTVGRAKRAFASTN